MICVGATIILNSSMQFIVLQYLGQIDGTVAIIVADSDSHIILMNTAEQGSILIPCFGLVK